MSFQGLTEEVFATYSPDKWSSMVHNLARMQAKEKLVQLTTVAAGGLIEELQGLAKASSDEIPNITNGKKVDSQWVYWFRDPTERDSLQSFLKATPLDGATMFNIAAQDKHCTLAVILREKEIWIGFRVAAGATVDRQNLQSKLEKSWERESLVELMQELPEGTVLGSEGKGIEVSEISPDDLAHQPLSKTDPLWQVGHSVSIEDAIGFGGDLADHLARWLGALVPVYRVCAWSRDNDFIAATKQIQQEKQQQRKQATSFKEGDMVRVTAGLFSGQLGEVLAGGAKSKLKVRVGKMTVEVPGKDLVPA